MIKVGINGFGRIGRLSARIIAEKYSGQIEIVAINDLSDINNLVYLYNHDTAYRAPKYDASIVGESLVINGDSIKVYANKVITTGMWEGVDVVLECTGYYLTSELAKTHIDTGGSKQVLLSAPAKSDEIPTIVMGANLLQGDIISNASCTTNCIAPILSNLVGAYNILSVSGVTVHANTATQYIQDGISPKDLRSGRAGFVNLIPTTTGAHKAIVKVVPQLAGKISLSSLRAPVITGSVVYLTLSLTGEVTVTDINDELYNIAQIYPDIIEYSTDEIVSSDIIGNSHSVIIDSKLTSSIFDGTNSLVQLVLWYDNEWGYSNRLIETMINIKK